jgi:hypothetical protein
MISWVAPLLGVGITAANPAEASLASDNDNPAAAPKTGAALLKRLRFEPYLVFDMIEPRALGELGFRRTV